MGILIYAGRTHRILSLPDVIRGRIRAFGPLSFADFMGMALYHPEMGYYEREVDPGRAGDFYTSVSVGPLFGELLAGLFTLWARENELIDVVECGAHRGALMVDIAGAMKRWNPDLFKRARFAVVEPSPVRQGWQQRSFEKAGLKVAFHSDWEEVPKRTVQGVIYSNELLDAMPVKVWRWSAESRQWVEMGIGLVDDEFAWQAVDSPPGGLDEPTVPRELEVLLPDGFLTETCPAAENWICAAANALGRGHLLTIDYGLTNEDFFIPQRVRGTLRTYLKHQPGRDPTDSPGGQDITASVNFSRIRRAGESLGLATTGFERQGRFLTGLLAKLHANGMVDGGWAASRAGAFRTLTSPEFLGDKFHVLTQQRTA